MSLFVITYVTHSSGTFDKLKEDLKNKGVELVIIGWGTKWQGYKKKTESIISEVRKYKDDDILVIIDGFDVLISNNFDADTLYDIYKSDFNDKVLVSLDPQRNIFNNFIPDKVKNYVHNKIFTGDINAGMYMGSKKILVPFLDEVKIASETDKCKNDDQCAMNSINNENPNIIIDTDKKIFNNLKNTVLNENDTGMFYGYPGTPTVERILRIPSEYFKFFKTEILILILILIVTLYIYYLKSPTLVV